MPEGEAFLLFSENLRVRLGGNEPPSPAARSSRRRVLLGTSTALAALGLAAVAALGADANAVAWGAVLCLLVAVAAGDVRTRRIPNRVTGTAALVALALRAVFEPGVLPETILAGALAGAVFLVFAAVTRGLGMGDVKLAALLGLLLGPAALPALVIGAIAGGVVSAALIARSREWLGRSIAYGPYLCLGGVAAILAFNPPNLV